MKAITKFFLGIGSIVPLGASIVLGAYLAYRLISFDLLSPHPSGDPFGAIEQGALDTTDFVVFGVSLGLIVIFEMIFAIILVFHAAKDPRLTGGKQVGWIVALLFMSPFAFPIYFVLYVMREPIPRRISDLERAPIAS